MKTARSIKSFRRTVVNPYYFFYSQQDGVFMDSKIATGTGMENKGIENKGDIPSNAIIQEQNFYDPMDENGNAMWVEMSW